MDLKETAVKDKAIRGAMAFAGIVLSAYVSATLLPWIMLVAGGCIAALAIALLVVPVVRTAAQGYFPAMTAHRQYNIALAGAVGFCLLLSLFSISTIRGNGHRRVLGEAASHLTSKAESAMKFGELDQAAEMIHQLESNRNVVDPQRVRDLRRQVDLALKARDTKRANERVLQLVIAATQDLLAQRFSSVESKLIEIFKVQGATEFGEAPRLANRLLEEQVKVAQTLMESGDLEGAETLARSVENLPGVTDKRCLVSLHTQIINRRVASKVTAAKRLIQEKQWVEAERVLNDAIATKVATNLDEAHSLLRIVKSEREGLVNAVGAALESIPNRGQAASFPFIKSRFEPEGNIMELYAVSGTIDENDLKAFCMRKQLRSKAKGHYYIVIFDDVRFAHFPSRSFSLRFDGDESHLTHIRAIYEYNRLSGSGELEFYERNAWEGQPKRLKL